MQALLDFAEGHREWLDTEKERIVSLRRQLSSLTVETIEAKTLPKNSPLLQLHIIGDGNNNPKTPTKLLDNHVHSHTTRQEVIRNNRLVAPKVSKRDTADEEVWLKLGKYEDKKKVLANERRREYNEFLKEKARLERERQSHRVRVKPDARNNDAHQLPLLLSNYKTVLEKKRQEEDVYRKINGLNVIQENEEEQRVKFPVRNVDKLHVFENSPAQRIPVELYPIKNADKCHVGENAATNRSPANPSDQRTWFTETNTNQKFFAGTHPDLDIHMRSNNVNKRLPTAEARRLAALRYREELKKQVEEKKLRDEEERQIKELEDRRLENKIEEQRQRMMREYQLEEDRIRKKTDELIRKQEAAKASHESPNKVRRNLMLNQLPPRSPSYLHVKMAKPAAMQRQISSVRALDERFKRFTTSGDVVTESDEIQRHTVVQENRLSPPREDIEPRPSTPTPPRTGNADRLVEPLSPFSEQIQSNDRILNRLAEVKRKMQEDHTKMIQLVETGPDF